ncbi:sigma 54-interacting transcriptional regulator [Chondromyces crocatus]|uniref:Fis family transcriptional regulator n=1 Tax=Chondromyces crocatus TaxID=52 RepID=A0A0K1ERX3_CHOCO|nr:sigma 54-interacting transcriptional regulator [Chondromyces crocatus]AKT43407.1 Fis family transcriptional regulator [Chondromyces crocatus]
MPTLKCFSTAGTPRLYSVHKPVTTLGKALGNDLALSGAGVREHHAQIVFDGRDFVIEECEREGEIAINGKKKRRARLVHGDRVQLGGAEIGFSMFSDAPSAARRSVDEEPAASAPTSASPELAGVRKLFAFSEKLSNRSSVDELLEAMLDDVIEVTHADKGFLLLIEGAEAAADASNPVVHSSGGDRKLVVRASRNVRKEAITNAAGGISDSIVQQVLESNRPVIVSDALADTQFGRSESVIAMKLSSVMCVPLVAQGQLIGALYVGNDKIKHLFDRTQLDLLAIFASQSSLILQNAILVNALRADKEKLTAELKDKRFGEIIGACPSMLEVFRKLQKVAATDISVLITGETGTGKELIAREVHRRSNRANGPFITINCGAIPENLIESELFGHVKGAFTGAIASRPGKFQLADKGTLFLDEIGELPLNLQVKLLRALQERVVFRVGDSKPEKVDIRVVAATNRTLEDEIKANNFREDLYYRLNVVNLWMPPLRDRGDDVLIIAKALLSKYADELQSPVRGYSPAALAAIKKYTWPGNIRQLENRIKKALVLCDRPLLGPEDLDLGPDAETPILPLEKAKEEFQRRYVLEVLERNNGNRTQTARDLGVDPRTIFRYLEREQNPMPSGAGGVARDPSEA